MLKNAGLLARVKKVVRKHVNWLVASFLGTESLAEDEKKELKGFSLGKPILDFVRRSFLLGKLFAKTPNKKQKKLNTADLDKFSKEYELTPLDDLALSYAKTQAAAFVYSVTDDMAASVLARMAKALGSSMSASVQAAVVSEAKAAVAAHKTLKEFASSLASKLQVDYKSRLIVVAQTELHRAVTQGVAQSIIQKQDVFKYGDGLESLVSIVPKPGTCPDCAKHYLDSSGNPKVMKLSSLISMGSNADPGTSHKKSRGVHTHWKTTLPPMHPSCQCEVVFIPSGFSWVNGELKLTQPRVFHKSILMKAQESKLSPVAKPPGPPQSPKPASPGNIPGVAAPKSAGSASVDPHAKTALDTSGSGNQEQMVPCPFNGGDSCIENGGNGAKTHKAGGAIMKAHQEALARGAKPDDPEAEDALVSREVERAKAYGKQDHPRSEVKNVLSNNKIVATQSVTGEASVAGTAEGKFIAVLENGGRALAKPHRDMVVEGTLMPMKFVAPITDGVQNEVYVPAIAEAFGLGSAPATVERDHEGAPHSFQAWGENTVSIDSFKKKHQTHDSWDALKKEAAAAGKEEELRKAINDSTALAIATNLADQHADNLLVDPNSFEMIAIDNEAAFGIGVAGMRNFGMELAKNKGIKIEVSDENVKKFDNMTFSDVRKTMPKAKSWQVTQTVMRMKYMSYLQKAEGHLDPDKFLPVMFDNEGAPFHNVFLWGPGKIADKNAEFEQRKNTAMLPTDLFDSFQAQWFSEHETELKDHSSEAYKLLAGGAFVDIGKEASSSGLGTPFMPVDIEEQKNRMRQFKRHRPVHQLYPSKQPYAKKIDAPLPDARTPVPRHRRSRPSR